MSEAITMAMQRVVDASMHAVPKPFGAFAVRSDEARHAFDARAPYGKVHVLHTRFLDETSLAGLVAQGYARVQVESFSDIDYATTTPGDLAAAAPGVADLRAAIADALWPTGVLGNDLGAYQHCVASRIDYLAARGAGFHNDVARHWSRSLFWVLALDVSDVEFVMPHAGVRLGLQPGDLLVFDQVMAHGLCRPADNGQVLPRSFETGSHCRQLFLTGELVLGDAQWAALGAPWLPVEVHDGLGALDLMVAEFDDQTGAIKRPGALRDSMKRNTCHVEDGLT
jgi:hypothetical protein